MMVVANATEARRMDFGSNMIVQDSSIQRGNGRKNKMEDGKQNMVSEVALKKDLYGSFAYSRIFVARAQKKAEEIATKKCGWFDAE